MGCVGCHGVWRAVKYKPVAGGTKEGIEGEWNERGTTLFSLLAVLANGSAQGGCSVPLKCDMRSLTYKLNVTTGGQFYFNRGDHRQATIHFPLFFPLPCSSSFALFRFFPPPPLPLLASSLVRWARTTACEQFTSKQ